MGILGHLDAYGTDDPDFNEGHPEDRCPVCGAPVAGHVGGELPDSRIKWQHRRHAVLAIPLDNL
ncbi:hypothetical protein [Arthrobacter sp. SLBN-53]|uniref:hypothetical protein n=1 Tax=Arthrobacter sp. SLBN-53 TaxID=2768412 RepID=UPI0011511DE6|nr:hypothetical protein [Arthrobacter sp. SLBN-53]TQK29363.1 hypothetical protein FBY28_2366 [Arthrobacter sp. SLBN-53]